MAGSESSEGASISHLMASDSHVTPVILGHCTWNDRPLKGGYCPPVNDSINCWPPTPPNTTIYGPCPALHPAQNNTGLRAHRTCGADGTWSHGDWTNYSACMNHLPLEPEFSPSPEGQDNFIWLAEALRDIYLAASVISLVFLLLTLFIFCYFRSLQCSRISIHKHLVVSFIFRFILILVMMQPFFTDTDNTYRQIDWLCKTLTSLLQYTLMSNFAWMLVEGIYLHNRLAVCVFRSDAPFKIFCFIGWGVPLVLTCVWAALMEVFYPIPCWQLYSTSPFICLIFVPILIALVINCAFLVNIIRVLVVKLRTNNRLESLRIRKAIKATIILLPLLGMTNLLFLLQPAKQGPLMVAYRVVNAILPSCQGIFVSVLYCFMNVEVQSVIRKKWNRFRVNRALNTRSRRQGSRTSSFFLSQSETAVSKESGSTRVFTAFPPRPVIAGSPLGPSGQPCRGKRANAAQRPIKVHWRQQRTPKPHQLTAQFQPLPTSCRQPGTRCRQFTAARWGCGLPAGCEQDLKMGNAAC